MCLPAPLQTGEGVIEACFLSTREGVAYDGFIPISHTVTRPLGMGVLRW